MNEFLLTLMVITFSPFQYLLVAACYDFYYSFEYLNGKWRNVTYEEAN